MQPPKNTGKTKRRESAPLDNRLYSKDAINRSGQARRRNDDVLAKKQLAEYRKKQNRADRQQSIEYFDNRSTKSSATKTKVNAKKSTKNRKIKKSPPKAPPLEKSIAKAKTRTVKKRRKQNYSLYYIFGFIFLFGVIFLLSNTVLFNIKGIEILGETSISHEQIITASGVKYGENLLRLKTDEIKQNILNSFVDIEQVNIKRDFFGSSLKISVVNAVPYINLKSNGQNFIVSESGRLLNKAVPVDGLITVQGFNIDEAAQMGQSLKEIDESKYNLINEIIYYIKENQIQSVNNIDVNDKYNISFVVDDRIICELGANERIEDKIHAAAVTISKKIQPNEKVTLLLNNPEKVYVKNNAETSDSTDSSQENG